MNAAAVVMKKNGFNQTTFFENALNWSIMN
jgi:hypothetical protein